MRLPTAAGDGRRASSSLRGFRITWLGHATFLVAAPDGTRLLFDPFLANNPSCPAAQRRVGPIDIMLITHGHHDHCEDAAAIGRDTQATAVATPEVCRWLGRQGLRHVRPMNIGGRQRIGGIDIAMVAAVHSSSVPDGSCADTAAGYVVRAGEAPAFYFAGDTALFGDMRVIGERHAPEMAFLPIGDRYTMGPEDAAAAARWLGVRLVIPMHYGTYPELTGTAAAFARALDGSGIEVLEMEPGVLFG